MKTQEELVRQYPVGPIRIYKIYQEGYQDRELDDLDAFRREAAKDILAGFAGSVMRDDDILEDKTVKDLVKTAVMWADELIKQLKEEQKWQLQKQ